MRFSKMTLVLALISVLAFATGPCAAADGGMSASNPAEGYKQFNLVSDLPGLARTTDPNLVNPWGLAVRPSGNIWVSDNGTGLSTVYRRNGHPLPIVINIPGPGGVGAGAPTGLVFNPTNDFKITENGVSAPSKFIYATEDGTILGWNPDVDTTTAIIAVDNSGLNPVPGAVYKGIALGQTGQGNFIYVTNFRAGVVEMYDANFSLVTSFTDPTIPAGFAPFGIRNIRGQLFVTYAKQDAAKHDDVAGPGNGFVDIFDLTGNFVTRFASQGTLNSPWGLALAPARFGAASKALLVGNFGDGRINIFDFQTASFKGQLLDPRSKPITIDGLWGLDFGKLSAGVGSVNNQARPALFFTAGINHEANGLFGFLRPFSPH